MLRFRIGSWWYIYLDRYIYFDKQPQASDSFSNTNSSSHPCKGGNFQYDYYTYTCFPSKNKCCYWIKSNTLRVLLQQFIIDSMVWNLMLLGRWSTYSNYCRPSMASIASLIATTPFQISSKDGWISSASMTWESPRSSGTNEYLTLASNLAQSVVEPVVASC